MSTAAVMSVAEPKTMRRGFGSPPMMLIQTKPETSDRTTIMTGGIDGFTRKSLKPMATYCLSSTATKKIGSEKKRNDAKVTV